MKESTTMATISTSELKRNVSVHVRVRPLTVAEQEDGKKHLQGLNLVSDEGRESIILSSISGDINGFDRILGQNENNVNVFEKCFSKEIDVVIKGGTASLFCYGYTGGGKTHTTIGYGNEKGLFFLGAEKILQQLAKINTDNNCSSEDDMLFLRATACEMYLDKVYDLLGEEKLLCKVRIDGSGQLVVGAVEKEELNYDEIMNDNDNDDEVLEKFSFDHATIKTRVGLRSSFISKTDDLDVLNETCVAQRATGISTTHHQSSRSHAILYLEVVTKKSQKVRDEIEQLTAELPPLKNCINNIDNQKFFVNVDTSTGTQGYGRVLRSTNVSPPEGANPALPPECEGDLWIKYENEDRQFTLLYQASSQHGKIDIDDADTPRTAKEWSERLGIENLQPKYATMSKNMTDEEIKLKIQKIDKKIGALRKILKEKENKLENLSISLKEIEARSVSALGGKMVLVDLAGADYDHRSGKAQKETAAINKSLLALKEVFRSLSSPSTRRPRFRNSNLTRILEDSLCPTENSKRKNKDSSCVMLVNISPDALLEKGTINALRYGQIYASSSNTKNRKENMSNSRGKMAKPWEKKKVGMKRNFLKPADPKVLQELREIYSKYVPEKTKEEVEVILKKFAGREALLLAKVQSKYVKNNNKKNNDEEDVMIVNNKKKTQPVPPPTASNSKLINNKSPLVKNRPLV